MANAIKAFGLTPKDEKVKKWLRLLTCFLVNSLTNKKMTAPINVLSR